MSILENLTSVALIYFHKSRIVTNLADVNFAICLKNLQIRQKLVRFKKPSVVNWKCTKENDFCISKFAQFFSLNFQQTLSSLKKNAWKRLLHMKIEFRKTSFNTFDW